MSDANKKRDFDVGSEGESQDASAAGNEAKTLVQAPVNTGEDESAPSVAFQLGTEPTAQTHIQTTPENDATEPMHGRESVASSTEQSEINENTLEPSRLRFALVALLFIFMSGWLAINHFYQPKHHADRDLEGAFKTGTVEGYGIWEEVEPTDRENPHVVVLTDDGVKEYLEKRLLEGDEIISLNNIPRERLPEFLYAYDSLDPGEKFVVTVKRDGELHDVTFTTKPFPLSERIEYYFLGVVIPLSFLLVGLGVFLLKPNYKPAFLLALAFILCSNFTVLPIHYLSEGTQLPQIFSAWLKAGIFARVTLTSLPVFFHLFLIFPGRLRIAYRFPKFERYLYLPQLVFVILPITYAFVFSERALDGLLDAVLPKSFGPAIIFGPPFLYMVGAVAGLIVGYRQASEVNRRRIRILVSSITLVAIPILVQVLFNSVSLFSPELYQRMYDSMGSLNRYFMVFFSACLIFIPLAFAYAIVQHRVIPVSFVIRRGVQYLLAKNGLRLLLVLPIVGILWNIIADPNRTLADVLVSNTFAFYVFVALAVGLTLLMRYRLSEWIDRRFFREQYDRDRIFRGVIESIKNSDSMLKVSRLASSQIHAALHPASVHFFFEGERDSGFSVGYTSGDHLNSLRIPGDSPLLRMLEMKFASVDIRDNETSELPPREHGWLQEMGTKLLVPMHGTDGKLAGFLALGEKLSEIPYTGRDRELLEGLAGQIALVQENMTLKDRIVRDKEIRTHVLSRFEEGDINLLKECPSCGRCFDRTQETCSDDKSELTFTLPVERTIEDRYRLEKLIGKGGMGAVYMATDLRIDRSVAVKILSGSMFGNREALRRFEREAQTAGRIRHSNLVTVFDYGLLSTEGAFLVMELIKGESLKAIFAREGNLDLTKVVEWFSQILEGLEAAHKQGVVHRDLKPDNILIDCRESDGARVCILDFGLARLIEAGASATQSVTIPGTVLGTLGYMPPEQLRGEGANERSDLFSVAVMAYEALYGSKPFGEKSFHELLSSMHQAPASDLAFADFFRCGLAFESIDRFESASEMKAALINSGKSAGI